VTAQADHTFAAVARRQHACSITILAILKGPANSGFCRLRASADLQPHLGGVLARLVRSDNAVHRAGASRAPRRRTPGHR